jgi:hypothetical protein
MSLLIYEANEIPKQTAVASAGATNRGAWLREMTYSQLLEIVFSSGRIESSSDNWEEYAAEVKAEVEFEASERLESGELEGTVDGAVEFALERIG